MEVHLLSAVAIGCLILLIYHFLASKYLYFLSKPIPCVRPTFLLGNIGEAIFRTKDVRTLTNELYYAFPNAK